MVGALDPSISTRVPFTWGARPEEMCRKYPCDGVLERPGPCWFRAVTVTREPSLVFRWLCQLKMAPYSYDLIDNLGRRSPPTLTPGADDLAVGQRVMTIFRLVDFEVNRHLTLRMDTDWALQLFGDLAMTYAVYPEDDRKTRLVAKLVLARPSGAPEVVRLRLLAWGDLVMMRRQLHTLRDLAEASDSRPPGC